ncbi:MAG: prolyl oligopeptidase family serine peptidase [Candidatus Paceibacterota bacterium]
MSKTETIKDISIIESVEPIKWDEAQEQFHASLLNESQLSRIRKNKDCINVFRIQYRVDDRKVTGFIIQPAELKEDHPVIIWNRGGTMEVGVVKIGQIFIEPTIVELVKEGYILFLSQYSGQDGSGGSDQMGGDDLNDVLKLYTIAQELNYADENRVGMYGISRGGLMTYLALAKVNWIKAAVTVGGRSNVKRAAEERSEMEKRFEQMFNATNENYRKRSAVCWPDKFPDDVPVLLMHGASDRRVNPLDSIDLSTKLLEHRKPHRLMLFEGADHAITEQRGEMVSQLVTWCNRFVKEKESVPDMTPHGK